METPEERDVRVEKKITVRRSTMIQEAFNNILNNCTMAREAPM